jgi:D-hydroxyproline dehydrogenase subunit gamma
MMSPPPARDAAPADTVRFQFDGSPVTAHTGATVAAALLAVGIRVLGRNPADGSARGLFCAMGVCQECLVLADDVRVEACRTVERDGMVVRRLP